MTQQQDLQKLFIEAQQLAPDARAGFVEEATEGNPALKAELLELLDASEAAGEFFDGFASRVGIGRVFEKLKDAPQQRWPDPEPDEDIGAYTLIAEIGRGGMGTVWRARRNDGRFEGEVAIKLLTSGGIAAQRFKLEGHFLARLSHPGIARLLDAGVTDAEQPYLVMELAQGLPIDTYCEQNRLGLRQIVALVIEIAAAVSHAHAHLIVHRDIKPSNILVDDGGTVKLLDFGVAKLLDAKSRNYTQDMVAALTPAFAAPEQLLGKPITTATDVYALGLLLYALLAGRNPREDRDTASLAELHTLATAEPQRLSEYLSTASEHGDGAGSGQRRRSSLQRRIRGDIDNILLKALAVQADDRYATVQALADDLKRYLQHEPVSAQAPTVSYRLAKFVRRNRGSVTAGALSLAAILILTATTAVQMFDARRQRDIAFEQQQRLTATNEFLQQVVSTVRPQGEAYTFADVLDHGVHLVETQYSPNESFAADMLLGLSSFYASLGDNDRRRELLDRSHDLAISSGDTALAGRTRCARARILAFSEPETAAEDIAYGWQMLSQSTGDVLMPTVDCRRAAALLKIAEGNHDGAIADFRSALALVEESPLKIDAVRVTLMNDMAEPYFATNRLAEAAELLRESISLAEEIGRGNLLVTIIHRLNYAAVIARMGEIASAAAEQELAVARLDTIGQPLVGARQHFANSLVALGRYEEALSLMEQNLADAIEGGNDRWEANTRLGLGRTLGELGSTDEAFEQLNQAEAYYQLSERGQQRNLSQVELNRIRVTATQDPGAAYARILELLTQAGYPGSEDAPNMQAMLRTAAELALAVGDFAAAFNYADGAHRHAVDMARDVTKSGQVGTALLLRAEARRATGDVAGASADLAAALPALEFGLGENHEYSRRANALIANN